MSSQRGIAFKADVWPLYWNSLDGLDVGLTLVASDHNHYVTSGGDRCNWHIDGTCRSDLRHTQDLIVTGDGHIRTSIGINGKGVHADTQG